MSLAIAIRISEEQQSPGRSSTRLQELATIKHDGDFLRLWKETERVLSDPPTDPLMRSLATFRDKLLEVQGDRIDLKDLQGILFDLRQSPDIQVAEYWREFKLPPQQSVRCSELSEAVREFVTNQQREEQSATSRELSPKARGEQVLPLLLEIRNDVKAVKFRPQCCSAVFDKFNSCLMQSGSCVGYIAHGIS